MRRGLISRSKAELPDAVLDARLARVRAAMDAAGLDALLLYTNNTRAAGVSWLTGFVPYWSEALLVVPRDREPVLVVALSYRVKSWIERTSCLAEVIHGPRIGFEAAKLIAAWKPDAAVGIADLDGLAAGIVEDLRRGGPRLSLSDATALFAPVRAEADPAEIALAMRAAAIAQHALAQTPGRGASLGESIAAIEAQARTDGAEEVYVPPRPTLTATAASGASRARPRWAKASRSAPPSPTKARGFASRARSCAMAPCTRRRRRWRDWLPRSRSFQARTVLPDFRPGWSRAAGSRSRSSR